MTAMNTEQFFRLMLPSEGVKILAEPVTVPGGDKPGWRYKTFQSFDAMAEAAHQLDAAGHTVYHACNGYGDWYHDPKKNKRRLRTQVNVVACRSLYDDVDVGKPGTYASRKEAIAAIKAFIKQARLPVPFIVASGGGLHLYWPFDQDITPEHWQRLAEKKRLITTHFGLKIDPACDTDRARVLRPVGTTWRKKGERPVTCVLDGAITSPDQFEALLDDCIALRKITVPASKTAIPEWMVGTKGNLDDMVPEFAPTYLEVIAEHCAQIKNFQDTGAEAEPLWHASAGVAKHCVDGEAKFHEWSANHQGYNKTEAQEKLDNWGAKPTTCDQFKKLDAKLCKGCKQTCKSPIALGVAKLSAGWLEEMNAQYAWIEKDAGIYRIQYRDFIQMDKFHAAHANQTAEVTVGKVTKNISYSHLFLQSKNRSQFRAIVTRPEEPAITADNCLNDWDGFTCEPVAGDVAPFKKLYAHMFGEERYPLLWLAHLIQFPGVKMFVSPVVWSKDEGVGKNLLYETVGALFSPHHFTVIGQSEVDDDFCGWIPGKNFVIADEVRASKNDKSRDRLKLWTTSPTLRTHDKGQPKRVVDNLMNLVYLSNHADGMFLGDHDRRYYVHEVKAGPLPETLKQEFLQWRANGGKSHLFHYLRHVDLTGFDPKGRAPVTESKREMIEAGRSDLDRWALDVVSGGLSVGREVATAEELTSRFVCEFPHIRNPPPVATMGRVLVRMGAYRRENQVRLDNGRKVRALALVRVDYWKGRPESEWRAELEKRK